MFSRLAGSRVDLIFAHFCFLTTPVCSSLIETVHVLAKNQPYAKPFGHPNCVDEHCLTDKSAMKIMVIKWLYDF